MMHNDSFNRSLSEPLDKTSKKFIFIFSGVVPSREDLENKINSTNKYVYFSGLNSVALDKGGFLIGYFDLFSFTDVDSESLKNYTHLSITDTDSSMKTSNLNNKATWFCYMSSRSSVSTSYLSSYGVVAFGSVGPVGSDSDLEIGSDFIVEASVLKNLSINFQNLKDARNVNL
jgi:hypothetical protein